MKSARVRSNPMVANSVRRLGSDEQSGTKGQRLLILVQRRRPVYQMVKKTAVMVPAIAAGCHSWGKSGLNEKEASTCFHPRKASTARTASLQPSMLSRTEKELLNATQIDFINWGEDQWLIWVIRTLWGLRLLTPSCTVAIHNFLVSGHLSVSEVSS